MCWVCLDAEGQPEDGPLFQPCNCPRKVHPLCLARWQLRSAGRDEEKRCRFCCHGLPDWRASMQTRAAQDVRRCGVKAPATMTVAFNGQVNPIVLARNSLRKQPDQRQPPTPLTAFCRPVVAAARQPLHAYHHRIHKLC